MCWMGTVGSLRNQWSGEQQAAHHQLARNAQCQVRCCRRTYDLYMASPSPTAVVERGANGQFLAGNRAARGNPHAKRVNQLRSAFFRAVSRDDIAAVVQKVVESARAGDLGAAALLFQYAIGKPQQDDNRNGSTVPLYIIAPSDFLKDRDVLMRESRRVVNEAAARSLTTIVQ